MARQLLWAHDRRHQAAGIRNSVHVAAALRRGNWDGVFRADIMGWVGRRGAALCCNGQSAEARNCTELESGMFVPLAIV